MSKFRLMQRVYVNLWGQKIPGTIVEVLPGLMYRVEYQYLDSYEEDVFSVYDLEPDRTW